PRRTRCCCAPARAWTGPGCAAWPSPTGGPLAAPGPGAPARGPTGPPMLPTPSHASTRVARDHLAAACEAAGRPQDAVAALEISVAQRERALGPDHPESLSARSSLAHA